MEALKRRVRPTQPLGVERFGFRHQTGIAWNAWSTALKYMVWWWDSSLAASRHMKFPHSRTSNGEGGPTKSLDASRGSVFRMKLL
jgi:hypothetical protein